ncbi:hypothetical protein CJ739_3388 [Mariniflexile rhizosphaerae]|uniref:GNAT family N-acetyltransferase n=1 Tax=unclassified Mariniflexile TaxID=2643887 RepID=UPI000CBEBD3E|nr:GNAT family N-acetyltransferase [Mariniflexile sp. TRM1-10]AXP82450.1 hypothetical protein CJ739_3388 [Mariniflexile sp. TRM1-10]PLB18392.1 MAG: hypothetical protein TRG1_2781 [Flavobacteriaceae bacterium FS1-H7996/R]
MEVFPQLFHKENFKALCTGVTYNACNVVYNTNTPNNKTAQKTHAFKLLPEYVTIHPKANYKIKSIPQHNMGYAISLEHMASVEEYLQKHFNSKKRNIIKRFVNRLEHCFHITYKLYIGNISKEKYTTIMQALHQMIIQRFDERNEQHKNLNEWEYLLNNTYQQILEKKASLFVIYNNEQPIEISLNYHFDKILFSYISSYHTDYSKFGLGHVEIYKQLEWCIENGYVLFEMGVGGMDYKRRWSNLIYQYHQYIIYNPHAKLNTIEATLKHGFYSLKEYLKAKGFNEIIPLVLQKLKNNNKKETTALYTALDILKQPINREAVQNMEEINPTDTAHAALNRYRNDFLYTSLEHEQHTKVYHATNTNTYIISGKTMYQTILKNN